MRKIYLVAALVVVMSVFASTGASQSAGRTKREVTLLVRGSATITLASGNAKWVKGPDEEMSVDFNGRGGSVSFGGTDLFVTDKFKDGVDIVMYIEIDSAETSLAVKVSDQMKRGYLAIWCEKGTADTNNEDFLHNGENKLTIPFN